MSLALVIPTVNSSTTSDPLGEVIEELSIFIPSVNTTITITDSGLEEEEEVQVQVEEIAEEDVDQF